MNETLQVIPLARLALAFIPVCAVLIIIHRWSLGTRAGLVAVLRMVAQLLLVGYALTFIFESNSAAYRDARRIAMSTASIPMTNSLLAVGLVSLPGMMTGQILSGVTPLIAVRYQILAMCMIFGSAGLATSCFLVLQRPAVGPEGSQRTGVQRMLSR